MRCTSVSFPWGWREACTAARTAAHAGPESFLRAGQRGAGGRVLERALDRAVGVELLDLAVGTGDLRADGGERGGDGGDGTERLGDVRDVRQRALDRVGVFRGLVLKVLEHLLRLRIG